MFYEGETYQGGGRGGEERKGLIRLAARGRSSAKARQEVLQKRKEGEVYRLETLEMIKTGHKGF